MTNKIKGKSIQVEIDGKSYQAQEGDNLIDMALKNGVHIPHLCYFPEMKECLGTCRVCTVNVNGRISAACTLSAQDQMKIQVNTSELQDMRKALIELLFVEGNHYCPSCEKSGDCQLQALAYEMQMTAPRFHYRFNNRVIDYDAEKLLFEHNRCILCKRCTHEFENEQGERVFAFKGKGKTLEVEMNKERANQLSDEKIDEVVQLCPVGAIIKKGVGFDRPYGERKYDQSPISQIEIQQAQKPGEDHE